MSAAPQHAAPIVDDDEAPDLLAGVEARRLECNRQHANLIGRLSEYLRNNVSVPPGGVVVLTNRVADANSIHSQVDAPVIACETTRQCEHFVEALRLAHGENARIAIACERGNPWLEEAAERFAAHVVTPPKGARDFTADWLIEGLHDDGEELHAALAVRDGSAADADHRIAGDALAKVVRDCFRRVGVDLAMRETPRIEFVGHRAREALAGFRAMVDRGWFDHLSAPPESFSALVDYVQSNARRAQPRFATMAAIIAVGACAGNAYALPDGARMNQYALLVGRTGSGKDAPLRMAGELVGQRGRVRPIGLPASGEGLQDAVASSPELFVAVDEAAHGFLRMTGRNPAAHALTLMRELLSLYSASAGAYPLRVVARQQARPPVEHPAVSLLGATTPAKLGEAIGAGDVVSGLLGRFLIAVAPDALPPLRDPASDPMPNELRERLDRINRCRSRIDGHRGESEPTVIAADARALAWLQAIAERADREMQSATGDFAAELLARTAEKVSKVAGVVAVLDDPDAPRLTPRMIRFADAFVADANAALLTFARDRIAANDFDRLGKQVVAILRKLIAGELKVRTDQGRRFIDAAWAPWSDALRLSKLPKRQFAEVVDTLVDAGVLELAEGVATGVDVDPGTAPRVLRPTQ